MTQGIGKLKVSLGWVQIGATMSGVCGFRRSGLGFRGFEVLGFQGLDLDLGLEFLIVGLARGSAARIWGLLCGVWVRD